MWMALHVYLSNSWKSSLIVAARETWICMRSVHKGLRWECLSSSLDFGVQGTSHPLHRVREDLRPIEFQSIDSVVWLSVQGYLNV